MKRLLILPFLFLFIGCVIDESEDDLSGCQTFLECFDGRYFPVNDVMIKFSNNPNSIWIEVWDFSNECLLSYNNNETILDVASNENIDYAFNLISNDSDFIVIRSAVETYDDGYEYYEEIIKASITADGNLLWEYYDDLTLTGTSESYVYNMLDDSKVDEILKLGNCSLDDEQTIAQDSQDDDLENNDTTVNETENSLNEIEYSLSILDGVSRLTCGETTVPGTIQIDNCDWKPVFSDNRGNITAVYNEENKTLLIGNAGYFLDDGYNDTNDNREFIENILGSNKKGLFYMGINLEDSRIQPYQQHMSSLGNSGFIYFVDSPLTETISGLNTGDNELSNYDYLIFNPEDNRLNTSEISAIRSFIENPNKITVLIGMGWVWKDYYRENEQEQMPLNLLLEPYGVNFIVNNPPDGYTYDTYDELIFYPDTYTTKTEYFNCTLSGN